MTRATVILSTIIFALNATSAVAQGCAEAWHQRDMIDKQGGYCFRTPRAISAFGNARCTYDAVEDVPLSARRRAAVAEIQAFERANGCPR